MKLRRLAIWLVPLLAVTIFVLLLSEQRKVNSVMYGMLDIEEGMNEDQVMDLLGDKPSARQGGDTVKVLKFNLSVFLFTPYLYIKFEDGKVSNVSVVGS